MWIDALLKLQDISPKWADIRQDASLTRNDEAMNLNFTISLLYWETNPNINIDRAEANSASQKILYTICISWNKRQFGGQNRGYKTISLGYCLLRGSFITGIEDLHLFSFKRRFQANLEILFETAYSLLSYLHYSYQRPLHQIPPQDLRFPRSLVYPWFYSLGKSLENHI